MTSSKRLALDANILISAVLGTRVQELLDTFSGTAFIAADVCVRDAEVHLVLLSQKRSLDQQSLLLRLARILEMIQVVEASLYGGHQATSERRLASRDPDDWPVLATALHFDCPLWTEDQDFFGSGVATWTTQNVELYLQAD